MAQSKGAGCLTAVVVLAVIGAIGALFDDEEPSAAPPEQQATTQSPTIEATTEPTDEPSAAETSDPPPEPKLWPVVRVVDGDTVEVRYKGRVEPVRLIGIDTPETVHPTEPVECWGPRASTEAQKLLAGRKVELVFDPSQGRRDVYDRMLAYIEIPGRGDFGQLMIQGGHAAEYTYDSAYSRQAQYKVAEAEARKQDRGLWRTCGGVDKPLAPPSPDPPPTTQAPQGNCAEGYSPCVPPYPPDVDCDDVGGPIRVTGSDPHGLDADGDGVACES
jgi:micrococcal nuclease